MQDIVVDPRRDAAIAAIEECRQIHVDWMVWAKVNGNSKFLKVAGDAKHHRYWIKKYDDVLRVLRRS